MNVALYVNHRVICRALEIKSWKELGIDGLFFICKLLPAPLINFIKKSLYNIQSDSPNIALHFILIL